MNLVTFKWDILGLNRRPNPLSSYFNSLFLNSGLVDVEPLPLLAFWRNRRVGDSGIAKRLDQFLVEESFLLSFDNYRSWVRSKTLSNHQPLVFQVDVKDS